ncbi:MAG TPA: HEAT repeat domain-containing protein [Nitrospirae bacterium]|nr:HEAT repeat domain-containing protein [Nitrospirota bacterium]
MTGINSPHNSNTLDNSMIIDYMEKGFLDNIIDLFIYNTSYFPLILEMLTDERLRVRIGATALVEHFSISHNEHLLRLIPDIAKLLKHKNPTIRGDCAYILSLIKDPSSLPYLEAHKDDENNIVRQIIEEAIVEIKGQNSNPALK